MLVVRVDVWADVICPWCYLGRQYLSRALQARAADAGLTFNYEGQLSGNTRAAHRLIRLALHRGVQDAMVERLYRAYFTERRSVFDAKSLTALAAEVDGLDGEEVAAALDTDAFEAEVIADENQAYALGVTGVPFFVVDRRFGVAGAQPPEVLLQVLERAAAEPANP